MSRNQFTSMLAIALAVSGIAAFAMGAEASTHRATQEKPELRTMADPARSRARLERQVRHELVMLPYYSVFDNLAYRVDGGKVELFGQVVKPTLKSDAEKVVKQIEGVEEVVNNIEVLPLSPNDDRIRQRIYRAIYSNTVLQKYALQSVPPIHIIVRNGRVTLEGVVANEMDKNLANMQASGVSGVFMVTNNLRVE